jgi:hypothetical protein
MKTSREQTGINSGPTTEGTPNDRSIPSRHQRLGGSLALPSRRHPAHGIKYVDGQPTIIFDTICIKPRKPVLACDEFHAAFQQVAASATAWLMGRYVIMPDHIHVFAGEVGGNIEYENWITYLKSQLTKALGGRAPAEPFRNSAGSPTTGTRVSETQKRMNKSGNTS